MANTDDPGPFDPALLAAFARVIIVWSYVEQLQGQLLSFLLNAEAGRVFVISQNVSASTVTDWIRVLLQIPAVQATGIGNLSELLEEIDDARAERNALAHGLWSPAFSPEEAVVQTVRWGRTEVIKDTLVTIGDLSDLLHRIEDIVRKLRALARSVGLPKKDNDGMKRFTDAIAKAVADKNWLAATALSLTMPDICGRMEHPEHDSKSRYKAWWDKYMLDRYRGFLSGGDAYALRCAYVHEGSGILDRRARQAVTRIRFVEPNKRGFAVHNQRMTLQGIETLILQVDIFCQDMIDAVDSWSNDVASNEDVQKRRQSLLEIHKVFVDPIPLVEAQQALAKLKRKRKSKRS